MLVNLIKKVFKDGRENPVIAEDFNNMQDNIGTAINNVAGFIAKDTDIYDATLTYKVGELKIYNNKLYRCKTEIATAEEFNVEHWEEVNIKTILSEKQDKLTPGTSISITDNVIEAKDVYSMEEIKIGTWIDGKPLYRKVIQLEIPSVDNDGAFAENKINISDNIDNVIDLKGFADIPSTTNYRIFFPLWITSANHKVYARINNDKQLQLLNYVKAYSGIVATITVEYTKTTETTEA